ncbi:MAG: Na+/H+ antiporter subunit E [Desulfobacter sp.]|nr:Na+/H+ antiporter subunit E [Desulfobacter sp.]WDP88125.1 MAG: Na+/H+ antiporter subunit E [Desulfobacter sp.]
MFATWLVLSGNFSGLLVSLGVVSSLLVAWFFHDLLFPSITPGHFRIFIKFSAYIPWLIVEIIKANFHLLYLVFHPRMNELIDPHIMNFKADLESDLAITTLANSITLTPGTITVTNGADGVYRVHAIDKPSAQGCPGNMLNKVADIYGEDI